MEEKIKEQKSILSFVPAVSKPPSSMVFLLPYFSRIFLSVLPAGMVWFEAFVLRSVWSSLSGI
ncbi:hypothetical protein BDZ45DRAFT_675602 [Acephala macrosclerotiorum]|nr:hypothetical protein BDZ45DRAFT_675602 [Acephala macrosclerotiorum]